jgi:hypothetical protein
MIKSKKKVINKVEIRSKIDVVFSSFFYAFKVFIKSFLP